MRPKRLRIAATFKHGILADLSVTNASLLNGDTLNVATAGGVAFGDGVLTVTSSGKSYVIIDWRVI